MRAWMGPDAGPAKDLIYWKGRPFVSVSAVLNLLPRPGLVTWAARTVAQVALADPEALMRLAAADPAGAERLLLSAPARARQLAARRGTLLHQLAALVALGRRVRAQGDAANLLELVSEFVRREAPEFIRVGPRLFSRRHGYGGIADAIVRLGGQTLLLEYKTGGVYPEHRLQLAAYAFSEFIGLPGGREAPLPRIDGGLIVRVGPAGYELWPLSLSQDDFLAFLHALSLYHWLKGSPSPRDPR